METKWIASFLAVVALVSTVSGDQVLASENIRMTEPETDSNVGRDTVSSPSFSVDNSGRMVVISTMDGKVSALDESKGTLIWSVDTGLGALLSSSITKLQIKQDGRIIRLIPSLSGQLFKFDGNSIEALPFSAEQLLSSSYKISDGSILVGDNEVTSFGIDAAYGRIVYFCTATECDYMAKPRPESRIVVIMRHQKLVRSVDVRNGQEKWNFSVGKVSLDVSEEVSSQLVTAPKQSEYVNHFDKQVENSFATPEESEEEYHERVYETISGERSSECKNVKLKVYVPDGVVSAHNCESGYHQSWKYKFSSPIANAWRVDGSKVCKVDLFDPETVPALLEENNKGVKDDHTIYLGFYESHAYIQASLERTVKRRSALSVVDHLYRGKTETHAYPLIFSFHPYLATSNSLTEAVIGEAKEGELTIFQPSDTSGSCSDRRGVYVDTSRGKTTDIGYYFKSSVPQYGPLPSAERKGKSTETGAGDELLGSFPVVALYPNLLDRWKEVLFISFVTFMIIRLISRIMKNHKTVADSSAIETPSEPPSESEPAVFSSRYFLDFEPVRCLGKGGFGIVLESRHKVDARSYAIKRIRLPNKESARHKVLREVRALAKLSHQCIVRYFNAWIEEPPAGWQERMDEDFVGNSCSFPPTVRVESAQLTSREADSKQQPQDSQSKVGIPFTSESIVAASDASSGATQPFSFTQASAKSRNDLSSQDFSNTSWLQHSFHSSSAEILDSSDDKSIPFGRYGEEKEDSLSIVFQKSGTQPSADSAIEEDGFDKHHKHLSYYKHSPRSSSKHPSSNTKTATRNEKPELNSPRIYLYIQMELCQRESLHSWLANNQERQDQFCLTLFRQILSAVEYIHDCNLIHRDLKPSNIFFSSDGLIKVGDFGLVTASGDLCNEEINVCEGFSEDCAKNRGSHTEKVGTRLYMAPEQMYSRSYSQKVDIFALGLILIELFTTFSTQMERVNTLMESRNGLICRSFEAAYNNEANLARRMLSKKPSARPTASEAMRDKTFQK